MRILAKNRGKTLLTVLFSAISVAEALWITIKVNLSPMERKIKTTDKPMEKEGATKAITAPIKAIPTI